MPKPLSLEEQAAQTRLAAQTLSGLNTALATTAETQRKLIQGAAERASEEWQAAVKAVQTVQAAKHSGDYASARSALTAMAKIKTYEAPVDQDTMYRVQEAVTQNPATAGRTLGDPEVSQAAWLHFLRMFPNATTNEATLGTMRAMEERYGTFNPAYVASDSGLAATWADVQEKSRRQSDAIMMVRGYAEAAEGAISGLPTGATPTQVRGALASIESKYSPERLSPAMQTLERMVMRGPKTEYMTPEERELYEGNKKAMASMQARIEDPAKAASGADTRRDRIAAIVATPAFQFWAERNGFDVGTVAPADENATYSAGVVTPSGVYMPGPDDVRALVFAQQQRQRGAESQPHTPFLHRALNGERRTFGVVRVEQPKSQRPAEWAASVRLADGSYAWAEDSTGERVALSEPVLFMRDDETGEVFAQSLSAFQATEAGKGVTVQDLSERDYKKDGVYLYDPANSAAVPEGLEALVHREVKAPLAEYDTPAQEVRGQFLAPHVGDPIGSLRVLTETGERLVQPDEMVDEPTVTSGGGPRQTLGRFLELVRGRTAHNRAERGDEVYDAADRAAERVVPDQYSEQERERLALQNQEQERKDRAMQRGAESAGTTPERVRQRANDPEAYAQREVEEERSARRITEALAADEDASARAASQLAMQQGAAAEARKGALGLRSTAPALPPGATRSPVMYGASVPKESVQAVKTPDDGVISGVSATIAAAAQDAAAARRPPSTYGAQRLLQRRRQSPP